MGTFLLCLVELKNSWEKMKNSWEKIEVDKRWSTCDNLVVNEN